MVAQLAEDLVHLEDSGDRLDQDGGLDRAARDFERVLRVLEHRVPEPRLEMRLHLREVEVRPGAALDQPPRVVEEVEPEVDERTGRGLAVDQQVLLRKVPATRADQQRRDLLVQPVLASVLLRELDRPLDRVGEVHVPADHVRPGRRVRILEVGHEPARTGVERVDDHLSVGRTGDLDAPVLQVVGRRRHAPAAVVADLARLLQEVRQLAAVPARLCVAARNQQLLARGIELAVKRGDEVEGLGREDLVEALAVGPADLHAAHAIDLCSSSIGWRIGRSRPAWRACAVI